MSREFKQVTNLNTKKISEFTSEDTIYIQVTEQPGHPMLIYCQFIEYKNGTVYGKAISGTVNPELYTRRCNDGWIVKAKLGRCALYGKPSHEAERSSYHWFDASGYALDPRTEYKVVESQMHIKHHPSFGMVGFSRFSSSGNVPLFGSSIQSKQLIELKIHTAEHDRDINHDWYHARKQLISVIMSQAQFAELITSFNMGDGVPCTITSLQDERFEYPPFVSKVDMFRAEFKNKMHNLGVDINKLGEDAIEILQNKKTINKGDREIILNQFKTMLQHVQSNIPYVQKQFTEQMEQSVLEAKSEIESFVNNKIHTLGIEKLREEVGMPAIEATDIEAIEEGDPYNYVEAYGKMDKYMPDDKELQDEMYAIMDEDIHDEDKIHKLKLFISEHADLDRLYSYMPDGDLDDFAYHIIKVNRKFSKE